MAITYKTTFTVYFLDDGDKQTQYPSKEEAFAAASKHVGNHSYSKPFPHEDTYLFGPGNGDTSVMVRRDCELANAEDVV